MIFFKIPFLLDRPVDWEVTNCKNTANNPPTGYDLVLDAGVGNGRSDNWENYGLCLGTLASAFVNDVAYRMEVTFTKRDVTNKGYIGLAYNMQDRFNFDYFYIR